MNWAEEVVNRLNENGFPEAELEPYLDSESEDKEFVRLNVGFMAAVDVERDGPFIHFSYSEWDLTGGLSKSEDIACLDLPDIEQIVEMAEACINRYST